VVAERLDERHHLVLVEDRHRHAQIRQVADPALGQVHVIVEEDIARAHRLYGEITDDGVHECAIGPAGQFAQPPVVDAGPEIVRIADHRRARRPGDGGLDLHLDRRETALHDLEENRIGHLVTTRLP